MASMNQAKIIKAGGRKWVAGLVWRSFAKHPSRSEYREDARALGADWFVLRKTAEVTQTGFCGAIPGNKPQQLYSLAAAIAEEHPHPWRGIFKLSDKLWWYIAVRDGQAILPDGDVVGTHADILAALAHHDAYGDWHTFDGTIDDLVPLLEVAQKTARLPPLKSVKPVPLWRSPWPIILIAILAVIGFALYQHHQHMQRVAAQRRMEAFLRAQQQTLSPLATTSQPDAWLSACGDVIEPLFISQNGWLVSNVSCTYNQATIIWERLANATVGTRPPGTLSEGGNKVVQSYSLARLPDGQDKMQDYTSADIALYDLLQPINVQAVISRPVREPNQFYFTQNVNFTLPISPFGIDFNSVPGLRITSLRWTQAGWLLSGEIYAK